MCGRNPTNIKMPNFYLQEEEEAAKKGIFDASPKTLPTFRKSKQISTRILT
jgi:hypothetical protein